MSTSFNIVLITLLGISCFSCVTDFDLGIENNQQKIVVQSYINPDSLVKINVTGSIAFLSNENIQVLEEAEVWLYENNSIVDQLKLHKETNEFDYFLLDSFKPKAGNEYKVEVNYKDNQVTGETHIPAKTAIQSLVLDTTQFIVKNEQEYYKCSISFTDDLIQNYYQILLIRQSYNKSRILYVEGQDTLRDTTIVNRSFEPINIEAIDPQINRGQFATGILLPDDNFNGTLFTIEFLVPAFQVQKRGFYDIEEIDLYFVLRTITREMYEFELTANRQGWIIDNPFAEPLPVTGNIENGLGVFAGYNQDLIKVEIR
jgi:hypothetical protein